MKSLFPIIVALCALLNASAVCAQGTVQFRGIVDMVAQGDEELGFLNTNNTADGNFDPLRSRLFVEGVREQTQVYIQFLLSAESRSPIRVYGAYILHQLSSDREIYIEAGLIPENDGIWASNTYSNKNPLVGIPLMQYWKSNLHSRQMPVDMDDLLAHRGQGQTGIAYADSNGVRGANYASMPMLYDNCWNYGAFTLGAMGNFEFAAGVTFGPPGAPIGRQDTNDDLAIHGKVGYMVTPGFKVWISAATGAYLGREVNPYLPAGKTIQDYKQNLVGISSDWKWWKLHTMGEYFFNHFDTPLRADGLSNNSFYVQSVYSLFPGWQLAARYDQMRYEEVTGSSGPVTWDRNVSRVEGGVVYRLSRDLRLKGVLQATDLGTGYGDNVVPAVQMSFVF